MGFKEAKHRLIEALRKREYEHEARKNAESKNQLLSKGISSESLCEIVIRCQGQDHGTSPHHSLDNVKVHILKREGWYVKFYFLEPNVTYIVSVRKLPNILVINIKQAFFAIE